MARLLKQSNAFTFRIGPFIDDTDFKTAETALTIVQADIQISKNGGAFAQTSDASPTTDHDTDGWYQCPLTNVDVNTKGTLTVQIVIAGALPVWEHFMVVGTNVFDSLVTETDKLNINVTNWVGDVVPNATVSGIPRVDPTHLAGTAQSLTDLKDFVDEGYDPTTNKVQGVVLVDTTTTNTDMRGTDNAALASVATEARLSELDAANIPADVDLIKTQTDKLAFTVANKVDANTKAIDDDTTEPTKLTNTLKGAIHAKVNTIPANATTLILKEWSNDTEADLNITDFSKNRVVTFISGVNKGVSVGIDGHIASVSPVTLTVTTIPNFANVAVDDEVVIT